MHVCSDVDTTHSPILAAVGKIAKARATGISIMPKPLWDRPSSSPRLSNSYAIWSQTILALVAVVVGDFDQTIRLRVLIVTRRPATYGIALITTRRIDLITNSVPFSRIWHLLNS